MDVLAARLLLFILVIIPIIFMTMNTIEKRNILEQNCEKTQSYQMNDSGEATIVYDCSKANSTKLK